MKLTHQNINLPPKESIRKDIGMTRTSTSRFNEFLSPDLKNNIKERPFKNNSHDLAFGGLFFSPILNADKSIRYFNPQEIIEVTGKYLGENTRDLFEHIVKMENSGLKSKMFSYDSGQVSFRKKNFLHLVYDGMLYPLKQLPGEILNGIVDLARKFGPFKSWANKTYDAPFFKKIRQGSKTEAKINALRGTFEFVDNLKSKADIEIKKALAEGRKEDAEKIRQKFEKDISDSTFIQSLKMFDPKTGNYDTKHERSLTRIVSGAIPAFFLANDAYNLSRMCDDNPKEASKEKKIRLRQEASRVGLSAYITLVTLGAVQKFVNNSKLGIMLLTGTTVLFTEMISRIINGKSIVKLTPEQAKAINAKNAAKNGGSATNKVQENKNEQEASKTSSQSGVSDEKAKSSKKEQAPLLSFKSLSKGILLVIAGGYGFKLLAKIPVVNKSLSSLASPFKALYRNLTVNTESKMSRAKFNEVVQKLRSVSSDKVSSDENPSQFGVLADKFEEVAALANTKHALLTMSGKLRDDFAAEVQKIQGLPKKPSINQIIEAIEKGVNSENTVFYNAFRKRKEALDKQGVFFGEQSKGAKIAVDFVIAPFKFIFNTIKLPYTLVDKFFSLFKKKQSSSPDIVRAKITALSQGLESIAKETKLSDAKFKDFMNDNMAKSFNPENMSNISNSELANLAKTSATAATIWFLMADNHNMVMLKSNGEDKAGANQKFKERFVQEGSRLFYQTLLIDLFNSTFRRQYNASLWGSSWVTATCTLLGEYLTRKSVGMPVLPHTRDELIEIDKRKENTKGPMKAYYNFMTRLTGKKSLSEQHKLKQEKAK